MHALAGAIMGLFHYLFGFGGRINRAKQWAILLVGLVVGIVFQVAFAVIVGWGNLMTAIQTKTMLDFVSTPQFRGFLLVCGIIYILMTYITLAVATKRLHDRNKSAWWLLVFMALPVVLNIPAFLAIPHSLAYAFAAMHAAQANLPPPPPPPMFETPLVVVSRGVAALLGIWGFVELYCLAGTVGDNRYGPDPLARSV